MGKFTTFIDFSMVQELSIGCRQFNVNKYTLIVEVPEMNN